MAVSHFTNKLNLYIGLFLIKKNYLIQLKKSANKIFKSIYYCDYMKCIL